MYRDETKNLVPDMFLDIVDDNVDVGAYNGVLEIGQTLITKDYETLDLIHGDMGHTSMTFRNMDFSGGRSAHFLIQTFSSSIGNELPTVEYSEIENIMKTLCPYCFSPYDDNLYSDKSGLMLVFDVRLCVPDSSDSSMVWVTEAVRWMITRIS